MTSVSGVSHATRKASIFAATKAVAAPIRYGDAVRNEHDRISSRVTSAPALDDARASLSNNETYESDDTLAHTEVMKARGGRLDLLV
ncbi:MAG: hypothetical protein GKS03_02680 [Alphaproteobacteria bacterium]|nr:hypothetical protein [Alphaproteobacteria bacterium]